MRIASKHRAFPLAPMLAKWDNGDTRENGPGGALTPLFPGLAAAIKERD